VHNGIPSTLIVVLILIALATLAAAVPLLRRAPALGPRLRSVIRRGKG
jgi:hypothetical protein